MTTTPNVAENNTAGLRVFLTVFIVCAFFTNPYLTTNDASRFSLTVALAERGSAEITDILPRLISPGWIIKDYAQVRAEDGTVRIFSDKAPLGSFLGVPVYWLARLLGLPMPLRIFLVSLLTAGLLTALTALLIFNMTPSCLWGGRGRALPALTYGIGTMALFYGTLFFSSAITAFCLFASFYCLARMERAARRDLYGLLGGLLAGAAITSDYYAGIGSVCLLVYGLAAGRRAAAHVLLGFAIPIAALFLYHDRVFGAPWPLSYSYGHLFDQLHSTGFFGITAPTMEHLSRLGKSLFAVNKTGWGFFFTCLPVVFAIRALPAYFRCERRAALMILAMAAGYLYMNGSVGWFDAYSARFFMPLLPFLILPLAALDLDSRATRNAFFFFLGFSIMINLAGADRFMPEYIWEAKPGMQNLAGMALGRAGIRLGYANLIFLAAAILPVWLIGAGFTRPRRADSDKNPSDGSPSIPSDES